MQVLIPVRWIGPYTETDMPAKRIFPAPQHRISLRKPLDAGELPVSPVC